KRIEVKTFVLDQPQIYLEKKKNGTTNWQDLGGGQKHKPKTKKEPSNTSKGLPIESLIVGNFSITNGLLMYTDHAAKTKKEIADLNLSLKDISLNKPIGIELSALIDKKPVSISGKAGPVGLVPGKSDITLDFTVSAFKLIQVSLKGVVKDPMGQQAFDFAFSLEPFSPRKLMAELGQEFPVKTKDPKVLDKISISAKLSGNPAAVDISDGVLMLDDSNMTFKAGAKAFHKPDIMFNMALDKINIDRYLPPPAPKKEGKAAAPGKTDKETAKPAADKKKKTDYIPLRKLVLDGKLTIGELTAHGAKIQDVKMKVKGKDGIIKMNPFSFNLYQGSVASRARLNVQKEEPRIKLFFDAEGIQAGPLLKDAIQKDILEGTLKAGIELWLKGETPDAIKRSMNGKGELLFKDGAIVGIDLANMVRNVKTSFGMGEKVTEKPRTDFAELKIPFSVSKRQAFVKGAGLQSPLLRVLTQGKAHLIHETLDFRVEPKFVATLKGQGDSKSRTGLMVPILVTGTFQEPKFRPDIKNVLKSEIPKDAEGIKNLIQNKDAQKEKIKSVEESAKGLLKGFMQKGSE
ncbi:MAG: AsmA family protein, partial [Desulfobacteraceae bacterium]|nr:AsmA family protein [Desulfobacteraceae bacterium]